MRQAETFLYMQEMNPETLEALKLSIAHWERLANRKRQPNESVSVGDCALCGLFNLHRTMIDPPQMERCNGCPVFAHTGEQFCKGTPFILAEQISEQVDKYDEPMDTGSFQFAAQDEVDFLKSLLPKENP
jgi:hypothetical protein